MAFTADDGRQHDPIPDNRQGPPWPTRSPRTVARTPVAAIYYDEDLPPELKRFSEINTGYFERHPVEADTPAKPARQRAVTPDSLRVAIVGAGPAACCAANALIGVEGVDVEMFERLPTPFGLIRAGVAPDHQHTKSVVSVFGRVFGNKRFGAHLNVEIRRHGNTRRRVGSVVDAVEGAGRTFTGRRVR